MTDEIVDRSRVDAYAAARRRSMVLHSLWRPMLAGAVGACVVIACAWVAMPKFTVREVTVDHVVQKDVNVDRIVPHDIPVEIPHITTREVEIPIPRLVEPLPLAKTPGERSFTNSPDWEKAGEVRGRIVRAGANGFVLLGEDHQERSFYPAKIGPDGKPTSNPKVRDVVDNLRGDLAACRPIPNGVYACVAWHKDHQVEIRQEPIGEPL